jgi:hypothetical protein
MKRGLAVLLLIVCLSLPALAGHTTQGDRWCKCPAVQGICHCCGSNLNLAQENESISQHASDDVQPMLEIGIIRMAFLMWLKVKA